jgi:hypothetical protein
MCRMYANTMTFYIRDLSTLRVLEPMFYGNQCKIMPYVWGTYCVLDTVLVARIQ